MASDMLLPPSIALIFLLVCPGIAFFNSAGCCAPKEWIKSDRYTPRSRLLVIWATASLCMHNYNTTPHLMAPSEVIVAFDNQADATMKSGSLRDYDGFSVGSGTSSRSGRSAMSSSSRHHRSTGSASRPRSRSSSASRPTRSGVPLPPKETKEQSAIRRRVAAEEKRIAAEQKRDDAARARADKERAKEAAKSAKEAQKLGVKAAKEAAKLDDLRAKLAEQQRKADEAQAAQAAVLAAGVPADEVAAQSTLASKAGPAPKTENPWQVVGGRKHCHKKGRGDDTDTILTDDAFPTPDFASPQRKGNGKRVQQRSPESTPLRPDGSVAGSTLSTPSRASIINVDTPSTVGDGAARNLFDSPPKPSRTSALDAQCFYPNCTILLPGELCGLCKTERMHHCCQTDWESTNSMDCGLRKRCFTCNAKELEENNAEKAILRQQIRERAARAVAAANATAAASSQSTAAPTLPSSSVTMDRGAEVRVEDASDDELGTPGGREVTFADAPPARPPPSAKPAAATAPPAPTDAPPSQAAQEKLAPAVSPAEATMTQAAMLASHESAERNYEMHRPSPPLKGDAQEHARTVAAIHASLDDAQAPVPADPAADASGPAPSTTDEMSLEPEDLADLDDAEDSRHLERSPPAEGTTPEPPQFHPASAADALARELRARAAQRSKVKSPSDSLINCSIATVNTPSTLGTTASVITDSVLRASKYSSAPHGHIPANEAPSEFDGGPLDESFEVAGAPGKAWFLTGSIARQEGVDNKHMLLGGFAGIIQILAGAMQGFECHAIKPEHRELYPALTSHLEAEGFPTTCDGVFKYFEVRNKRVRKPMAAPAPDVQETPRFRYSDEQQEYRGEDRVYGTLCVSAGENVRDAVDALEWDLEGTGLGIKWKLHQSSFSFSMISIYGIPRGTDPRGVEFAINHALKSIERGLIRKGKLSSDFYDVELPSIIVSFRQAKKVQIRTERDKQLSLNNMKTFTKDGCYVPTIEGSPEDWPRLYPLIQNFWKSGKCRKYLGRRTKLVQMSENGMTDDRDKVQRLKRFHVVYTAATEWMYLGGVENMYKEVEVRMADDASFEQTSRAPKFHSLLRILYSLEVEVDGEKVPVIQAALPVVSGLKAGGINVLVRHGIPEAVRFVEKLQTSLASWFWHYTGNAILNGCHMGLGLSLRCRQSLMESFDIESARLATFSSFDWLSLSVTGEFLQEDSFLEEVEAEFAEELALEDATAASGPTFNLTGAREALADALNQKDDLDDASRSGASRRTNFSQSTGASSNRSTTTAEMARNHKERALQNAQLTFENNDLRQQVELNAARAREQEEQARQREAEAEALRAELEAMRARLSQVAPATASSLPSTNPPSQGNGAAPSDHLAAAGPAGEKPTASASDSPLDTVMDYGEGGEVV